MQAACPVVPGSGTGVVCAADGAVPGSGLDGSCGGASGAGAACCWLSGDGAASSANAGAAKLRPRTSMTIRSPNADMRRKTVLLDRSLSASVAALRRQVHPRGNASVMHLVAWHDAPEIGGGRILGPHLRALRIVAVPRPRLEIAELLVHAVELGEQFGDQAGRTAMIGEEVVADAVTAGPPKKLVAVDGQEIARRLHVAPIAQFERGVEMPVRSGLHQIDGVVVGPAAQEREEVAHPVGFAKAEHVAIELGDVFEFGDMERNVAELVRHDALGLE